VGDAGRPQGQQLVVQVIEQRVADRGDASLRQRQAFHSGRHPADQERVAGRAGLPGLDDLGYRDTGPGRPHREVRLVLDLLQPGNRKAGPGVPVEHEPANLRQQPGIGRVPAIDLDLKPAGRGQLVRLVLRHPPHLPRGWRQVAGADAEFRQQQPDVIDRGQTER
jgi:hypothetical protein